jgi:hypothetical protein
VLLAEVTQAHETAAATEATCAVAMLVAEASAREAIAARDSATLHVKDAEDRAALVEREAQEMVSREEVGNATVLAFAHEDAEGLARKFALLEDEFATEDWAREVSEREWRGQSEELTLLQTWGSKLCDAIIGLPQARHHLIEACGSRPSAILKCPQSLPRFGSGVYCHGVGVLVLAQQHLPCGGSERAGR